jgi:hypothetical protein
MPRRQLCLGAILLEVFSPVLLNECPVVFFNFYLLYVGTYLLCKVKICQKIFRPKLSFAKPIPGVDIMITIFCDFRQFSAKNRRFSQKPML